MESISDGVHDIYHLAAVVSSYHELYAGAGERTRIERGEKLVDALRDLADTIPAMACAVRDRVEGHYKERENHNESEDDSCPF